MKSKIIFIAVVIPFLALYSQESETIRESKALINRVLEGHSNDFVVNIIAAENGSDVFEVEASKKGKIILRGNNGISIATAFNWYLKEVAHISYDWQAIKPVKISGKLPMPNFKIHRTCSAQERFFNNTCTFGYTFVYWKWDQWERFIDWMAMNGVNRPLMLAGQEAVWLKVWKSFGMTDVEIRTYFSAPAHLPWHRMANMDKWGGPLPEEYIVGQQKLQQQILNRSRGLGMKPILPGFAGHVPENFKRIHPEAKIAQIAPGWGGMAKEFTTYFLDPTDTLFNEIQKRFLIEQQNMYGTNHLYSADPFNEIDPPSWNPEYLAKVGKTIFESMSNADKDAIWYQMSWTFYYDSTHWTQPRLEAMIHAVPNGKLIFLDYVCEEEEYFKKSQNFYGAPFIWCYLGNFGGNTHLDAPLDKVSKRMVSLPNVSNCIGVGSTLEGINVNPEIYELVMEIPWHSDVSFNLDTWVNEYALRRAGHYDQSVIDGWKMLKTDILINPAIGIHNHSIIYQVSPVLDLTKSFWSTNTTIPYKNAQLAKALSEMLQADATSKLTDAYRFDVVNLTRQMLGNYGRTLHRNMMEAYKQKNIPLFRKYASGFITLGMEIDTLLGTRHEFLLGKWLADARRWGGSIDQKEYYERNAREIITTWHSAGGGLTDYSSRQWNGLIRSYYLPRWIEFIRRLDDSMTQNKPFDTVSFALWCDGFEKNWVNALSDGYQETEKGDEIVFSTRLFLKYKNETYLDNFPSGDN